MPKERLLCVMREPIGVVAQIIPCKSQLHELHVLVEHIGPFREEEHIFRAGDPFTAIAAVRSGTVKTYVTDNEGREHVQGFFLPGEVIGLNAISQSRYPSNALAMDSVVLCRFSFPNIANRFLLTMTRTDIANYLRLASETVSRVFRRFQDEGLVHVERREIELTNRRQLEALVENVLRSA